MATSREPVGGHGAPSTILEYPSRSFGKMRITDSFNSFKINKAKKRPWPQPEDSICSLVTWRSPVKGKHCWSIQGPALDAYSTIRPEIMQCLKDGEQYLYEGSKESSVPHSIDCFMVGRAKTDARPYLVISCAQQSFSARAKDLIKRTSWWEVFLRKHEGFGGFLLLATPPRRLGSTVTTHKTPIWVYTSEGCSNIVGAPIFFSTDAPSTIQTCLPQQASLGGIVYLNDLPFGLTVAHPFGQHEQSPNIDEHISEADTVFYIDDSGDESTSVSDLDIESGSIFGSENMELMPDPDSDTSSPEPMSGKPFCIGKILYSSEGTPSDATDWALVLLSGEGMKALADSWSAHTRRSRQLASNSCPEPTSLSENIPLGGSEIVHVPGLKGGSDIGVLNFSESLVCLPGTRDYLSLPSLILERDVRVGECGEWVVDSAGHWYGHVVAGTTGTAIAYIAPASKIVTAITQTTACRISLVPGQRSTIYAVATFLAWERSFGSNSDVYARVFQLATKGGDESVVQLMIDAGVDLDALFDDDDNALQAASSRGYEKVVELLLKAGASDRYAALEVALDKGHEQIAHLLLGQWIDQDFGHYRQKTHMRDILKKAASRGNERMVRALLPRCVKSKFMIVGALVTAAAEGHKDVMVLLLEAGADVDGIDSVLYGVRTPLHEAASGGHEEAVQLLLEHGADVDIKNISGLTALDLAKSKGHRNVVRLLSDRSPATTSHVVTQTQDDPTKEPAGSFTSSNSASNIVDGPTALTGASMERKEEPEMDRYVEDILPTTSMTAQPTQVSRNYQMPPPPSSAQAQYGASEADPLRTSTRTRPQPVIIERKPWHYWSAEYGQSQPPRSPNVYDPIYREGRRQGNAIIVELEEEETRQRYGVIDRRKGKDEDSKSKKKLKSLDSASLRRLA